MNFRSAAILVFVASLVLNGILFYGLMLSSEENEINQFFAASPSEADAVAAFGTPVEIYAGTASIKPTGWTRPPWNSKRRIAVFQARHHYKVFAEMDDTGRVLRFWVGTS